MNNPLISIILPTYNVEKYIARALESCINQTFKDIEIIVVDDCGSDKSIDIAKEYASKDDRIKIIHNKENLKLLRARYEGVKVAGGGYIMFLDPDDYLELNACEEFAKILKKNNDVDLICFNFNRISNQLITQEFFFNNGVYSQKNYYNFLYIKLPKSFWNVWCRVFNKIKLINTLNQIIEELGPSKITMGEDAIIYFYFIQQIQKVITISPYLYNYNCDNTDSSSNNDNKFQIKKHEQELKYIIYLIENNAKSLQINDLFYIYIQINILYLKISAIDLKYKKLCPNFFIKILLKLQRKKLKNDLKKYFNHFIL
ncbi:glycosyltransferase family 2 protein [Campylobacter lari]|nr:glycosyltransferase family 2 protein [Campylobacter lari]EAL3894012.1 glycosyltransferase family 2 protein [Campylobacter lari]